MIRCWGVLGFGIVCLSLFAGCTAIQGKVVTARLGDAVMAAASEAKRAGASQLTYEASVTNTAEGGGSAAIVVPTSPVSYSLAGKASQAATTKVIVTVPLTSPSQAKAIRTFERSTPELYELDLSTLNARRIQ
jgi:hypothetical protein